MSVPYKLWNGDCREVEIDEKPYCMITDPPYEIKNKFGTSDLYGTRRMEFHFDEDGITEIVIQAFKKFLPMVNSYHTFCEFEQYGKIADCAREIGFTPKPYVKVKKCPPPPMPGNWWTSGAECAMYGYKSGAYFGDQSSIRPNVYYGDSYRQGIRANEKVDHPTQKWLPMVLYLVETLCPPDGIVIDPFMGSGTTGVACMMLGRKFIGIEKEQKYFSIAEKRIKQAAQQPALLHVAQQSVQRTGGESPANLSLFPAEVESPAKVTRQSTRR
jgi:DNA modification methylase